MGLFEKKWGSADLIDYTELKRRGILKVKEPEPSGVKMDSAGFVDLGSMKQNSFGSDSSPEAQSSSDLLSSLTNASSGDSSAAATSESATPSFASFFGDMGAVVASSTTATPETSSTANSEHNLDLGSMKVKVEDVEYKIDRLIDRLSAMEDKLREFENKARGV